MQADEYGELHSPQFHKNLSEYAAAANIPVEYITRSAADLVPVKVGEWLLQYPKRMSLVVNLRDTEWDEDKVCFAMAGMLTRNLLLARVLSMPQFFEAVKANKSSDPTCLLLPGFHGKSAIDIPDWNKTLLLDALREREMLGKRTVLVIRNQANLATVFGTALVEYIQSKFEMVKA